jgi:hypothetical protein
MKSMPSPIFIAPNDNNDLNANNLRGIDILPLFHTLTPIGDCLKGVKYETIITD